MLFHAAVFREDSITELARESLSIVEGLPVHLEVALTAKLLPTLGTGVDLCRAVMLLPPVSLEGVLVLEDLPAVEALLALERKGRGLLIGEKAAALLQGFAGYGSPSQLFATVGPIRLIVFNLTFNNGAHIFLALGIIQIMQTPFCNNAPH